MLRACGQQQRNHPKGGREEGKEGVIKIFTWGFEMESHFWESPIPFFSDFFLFF